MIDSQAIQENLAHILQNIRQDELNANRPENSVRLLAVSKTKPIEAIEAAINANQFEFGENYVQEGVDKILHFQNHPQHQALTWHFIGPIQSNKTKLIAEHFDWVHSVDRLKIAQRLSNQRPTQLAPLQVLIQVNTSQEASKSGVLLQDVAPLCEEISKLENIELRGLMSIPAPTDDPQKQKQAFESLEEVFESLKVKYPNFDTLSMGMSADMSAAIASGSTIVRIGSAIFGARN